jgi:uncharacterized membrane protein YeaQ/YmgE (transglycosylase-associated protein family)
MTRRYRTTAAPSQAGFRPPANPGSIRAVVGEIIGAVVLGIIAGYLARLLVPGRQDIGFVMTVVLGVAGSVVGYFIFAELLGIGDDDKFDLGGLPGAVIGAVLLLVIYVKFIAPRAEPAAAAAPAGAAPADRRARRGRRRR